MMGSLAILPVIFTLLFIAIDTVSSLECYKCSYVELVEGNVGVASMQRFIYEDNDNAECEYVNNPLAIPVVTCPDDVDYFCGYTHAYVTAYAHKVGKTIFHMHVRDCLKFDYGRTERIIPGTKCIADQETIEETLKPMLPHSIVSKHASGKICYCEEDRCIDVIDDSEVVPGACPEGSTAWGAYCIPWWLTWLGIIDGIILGIVGLATLLKFLLPPLPIDLSQLPPTAEEESQDKEDTDKTSDSEGDKNDDTDGLNISNSKEDNNRNKNRNISKKEDSKESSPQRSAYQRQKSSNFYKESF
jgi:hypothetical protein